MIVVCDTSPLNYLILVEADHVLPKLYGQVLIPPAVHSELNHERAPEAVRRWLEHQPEWIRIQSPKCLDAQYGLDVGETEAISLAKEIRATHLLIDERLGTKVAKNAGLNPLSTPAVLAQAARAGLINLRETLIHLKSATSFRIKQEVIDHFLKKE